MTPCSHLQEDDIALVYIWKLILLPRACRSSTAAEAHLSIPQTWNIQLLSSASNLGNHCEIKASVGSLE